MTTGFLPRALALLVLGSAFSFLLSGYYRQRCEIELLNALNDLTANVLVLHNIRMDQLEMRLRAVEAGDLEGKTLHGWR